jgi:hypothetical protein
MLFSVGTDETGAENETILAGIHKYSTQSLTCRRLLLIQFALEIKASMLHWLKLTKRHFSQITAINFIQQT